MCCKWNQCAEEIVINMARVLLSCLTVVVLCSLLAVHAAPQYGVSFAQANAQAGSFGGGGFGGPRPGFGGPGYGPPGFGGPRPGGFGGLSRFNRPGGVSISISKSVSIGRGGVAQSQSVATGK